MGNWERTCALRSSAIWQVVKIARLLSIPFAKRSTSTGQRHHRLKFPRKYVNGSFYAWTWMSISVGFDSMTYPFILEDLGGNEEEVTSEPRSGDTCPQCKEGKLDYDGMLNLSCERCGYSVAGCFT
jgi:hypothetical protein